MNQLFKAIVLEVGFNVFGAGKSRFDFLHDEQHEVLANSRLAASQRVMTSDLFAEAFLVKLGAVFVADDFEGKGFVLVYADSNREFGSSFSVVKSRYCARANAEKAAAKHNARGNNLKVLSMAEKVRANRGIIRFNLMSKAPYVESMDTPVSCSPASETYWQM